MDDMHVEAINIGKRFRVGEVECFGVEICEPCLHLQSLTRPGIIKDLIRRPATPPARHPAGPPPLHGELSTMQIMSDMRAGFQDP